MKKKFFSFLATIFMVLALFCGSVFAVKEQAVPVNNTNETELHKKDAEVKANASGNWYDQNEYGSGTDFTSWEITGSGNNQRIKVTINTANDLARFMKWVNTNVQNNGVYWKNAYVYLNADLDMSAHYWTPIGTSSRPFSGIFYGQGHTIKGLQISSSDTYLGFIGCGSAGVDDLGLDISIYARGTSGYVGGLYGVVTGSYTSIWNVYVNGYIHTASSFKNGCVGGIVGYSGSSYFNFYESINYTDIDVDNASGCYIGGIVGRSAGELTMHYGANLGTFATMSFSDSDTSGVGGIVGYVSGEAEIDDCVNYASITLSSSNKTSKHVGGILGYGEDNVGIEACVNYGNITGATNKQYIGGIAGRIGREEQGWQGIWWHKTGDAWQKNYIANCIDYGTVSGGSTSGSKAGYIVGGFNGDLRGNYVCGDFGGIWPVAEFFANMPSDYNTNMKIYAAYYGGTTCMTEYFFCNRYAYEEGGNHQYDFQGNLPLSGEYVVGWREAGDYGYAYAVSEAGEGSRYGSSGWWILTPLVKNYFDSNSISYSHIPLGYSLIPKYLVNCLKVNFKYNNPDDSTYVDLNDKSVATITSKGYTPKTATSQDIVYLKGAEYWSVNALYSLYYDTTEFSLTNVAATNGLIMQWNSALVWFKDDLSPVGMNNHEVVSTITYYLTAKPHSVTFNFVDESGNNISGCSTTRSTTFYYGQAYGNMSTVTPAMGYKLSTITANGSTIYVDIYGNRLGVVSVGTSWVYNTAVTSITFKFTKISYNISAEFTGDDAKSAKCYKKYWEIGTPSINVLGDLGYQYSITKLKVGEGSDQREYNVGYGVAVQNNGKSVAGNVSSNGIGSVIVVNTTNLIYGSYQEISLAQTDLILVINRTKLNYAITAKVLVENTLYTDGRGGDLSMAAGGTTKHTDTSGGQFTTSVCREDDFTLTKNIKAGYKNALNDANNLHYKITYYGTSDKDIYTQEISSINDLLSQSFNEIQNVICTLELDVKTYQVLVQDAEADFDLSQCVNLIETIGDDEKTQYWAKHFAKVTLTLANDDGNTFMFAGTSLLTLEKSYTFINDPNAGTFQTIKAESVDYDEFNKDDNIATPRIERNVYYISTYKQLAWLSKNIASCNGFAGCIIRLENDITMPDKIEGTGKNYNFDSIGDNDHPFKGVFDGQNHIIKDLRFSKRISISVSDRIHYKKYVGLFGAVSGATIKNLTISGGTFNGYSNVGIFAGYAENSTFENLNAYKCTLAISDAAFGNIYEEILITKNQAQTDSRISTSGNVIKFQYGDPSSTGTTIELKGVNCNTIVVDELRGKIGGIVGRADGCVFRGVSYNEGTITNTKEDTGVTCYAFAGLANSSTIIDQCFVYGKISTDIQATQFSNGGTLTDYYLRKGENNVTGQWEKNNANNWIVVGGKEVLKIFYWHW